MFAIFLGAKPKVESQQASAEGALPKWRAVPSATNSPAFSHSLGRNQPLRLYEKMQTVWSAEVAKIDPKNLTLRQSLLLISPIIAAFIPPALLLLLRDVPMVKYILGGWNLPLIMFGTYLAVQYFANRRRDHD